ncbi:hypothetical protein AAH174_14205 [Bacteroides thetaiotaomicron]|uniref:hypothetical protein n=1 Tax=Bacteroides thetaiotaomicron TaxID=818 RepID=UPI0021665B53|nr:hypothetical protein [Bacteroides thetaiotaomicron]MCS2452130.1 hypothetical protein [Bacteroides thetaiotaomicron]UVQ23809.1 hypothetical protein NXX60_07355 [Bacteroides thetaiotaomicron]
MKKIISNGKVVFILSKYATYAIYFIISLVIANKLGLFYFGIYGFLKLIIQYFTYSNLGVNYSSLVIMSEDANKDITKNSSILTSSIIITFFSLTFFYLIFVAICNLYDIEFYNRFNIGQYVFYIFFIVLIKQINQLYINIYRVYDRLKIINWAYIIPCIGEFIILFTGNGKRLLDNIMWAMVFSNGIVFIIFLVDAKFSISNNIDIKATKKLVRRGIMLLLYNISFYFIVLVAKSYISSEFQIEDFAQYSFSYNISDAVMLLNSSVSFFIYPNLINKLSSSNSTDNSLLLMREMQQYYMIAASLVIIIALIASHFLQLIVPDYVKSEYILQILLLSQLLVANSFIMTTFLVQQKKELKLIILGVSTIIVLLFASHTIFNSTNNIMMVSYALPIAMFFYNIVLVLLIKKMTNLSAKDSFRSFLAPVYFFPLIIFLIMESLCHSFYLSLLMALLSASLLLKRATILIKKIIHAK